VNRGAFDRLISVQRAEFQTDDYGGQSASIWLDREQAYARLRFGRADEKRVAAQEGGFQSATFEVFPTSVLLGTELTDRILLHEDNTAWDITEVAPLDRQTLRFTATRSK
jgi:head-tail adaptor